MSLQAVLANDVGVEPCTFEGRILTKSDMISYEVDGSKREYFLVTVGAGDDCIGMRIYQKNKINALKVNKSYTFEKVIRKGGDTPFWATGASVIYQSKSIEVSEAAQNRATEITAGPAENKARSIHEALAATSSSAVQGVVVKVSPLKRRRNGEIILRHLALRDPSQRESVKVALFGEEAEASYDVGDCIEMTNVYPYRMNNKKPCLSCKKSSKLQFLPKDTMAVDDLVYDEMDSDFEEEQPPEIPTLPFDIAGFQTVRTYASCPKIGCYNKKLAEGACPTCNGTEAAVYFYVQAIVKMAGKTTICTLFAEDLVRLTNDEGLRGLETEEQILDSLCEHVPLTGQGILQGKKLTIKF